MKLEVCKSHEKQNRPQAWEPCVTGTASEIVRYYDEMTHAVRINNGYRVIDDAGNVIDMQEFLFASVK